MSSRKEYEPVDESSEGDTSVSAKMSTTTEHAHYERKKGFVCRVGNHVLYCPDLSTAENSKPFYLHCSRHKLTYEIDLSTQSAEFIADFPHGCRESQEYPQKVKKRSTREIFPYRWQDD